MNQPNILVKVAAVASSLLLTGGFILYTAGAFDELIISSPLAPAEAGLDGAALRVMLQSPPPDTPDAGQPDTSTQPPIDTTERPREFFSGSKSAAPLIKPRRIDTPDVRTPDTSEKEPPPPRRDRFMGGSKSLAPLITPPVSDSQESAPAIIPDSVKPSKRAPSKRAPSKRAP